ncbi:SMC family ATPase, partial [Aquipuribacter sp. SD81]|uniref:SMC family ATPase n=1 Tax=Aquipuribacter sp. SD81 TaxID=3127703 RepID=UPI003017B3AF
MRPHRLRLTAFGPFPGTVDVDLDELVAAGPFLLHGPTGAGKTSLLDAVGFALFGRVPGARGAKQLRSHHAPDGVRTSVELWASVGGRAVHVVRTPDQERRRTRGTGWTRDKASVSVRVADDLAALDRDECTATWSGVQEANDELRRLVGMSHDQFFQVVLLPQGQFAQFLRASSDERAGVLRRLFDTARFAAVEERLRERAREAAAARDRAGATAAAAAAEVAALAGAAPEEVPATGRSAWVADLLDAARAAAAVATRTAAAASLEEEAARTRREEALTLRRLVAEGATLRRRRHGLQVASEALGLVREELRDAERAAPVAALHAVAVAAAARAEEAGRTRAALTGSEPPSGPAALEAALRCDEEAATAAAHAAARLAARSVDAERWGALTDARRDREERVAACAAGLAEVRRQADALPARLLQAQRRRDAEATAAADDAAAAHEEGVWRRAADLVDELEAAAAAAAEAEVADLRAREEARAAEAEHDRVRRQRLAGMAGELARALRPGEPCVVCGSREHPEPAADPADPTDPTESDRPAGVAGPEAEDLAREAASRAVERRSAAAARREVTARDLAHAAAAVRRDVPDAPLPADAALA